MKSKLTKILCLSLVLILCFSLVGCSKEASAPKETKVIKLGTLPLYERIITALKDELVAKGYKVEVVMFDANNMPAIATKDGNIDGYMHNHLPWIKTFNKENNCNLVMVKPYLFYGRTAIYSSKHKSLADLPKGAQIAVPNDPTNLEKSLLLLQEVGLITLKPKTDNFYTVLDIKDNPKNIKLIETEITTTARNINDADAVITSALRIKDAGLDPNTFLADDKTSVNYQNGLTVDAQSVNEQWVKDAMEILTSDKMKAKIKKDFGETLVFYDK